MLVDGGEEVGHEGSGFFPVTELARAYAGEDFDEVFIREEEGYFAVAVFAELVPGFELCCGGGLGVFSFTDGDGGLDEDLEAVAA